MFVEFLQTVGVYAGKGNKGVVLVTKKKKGFKPAKSLARVNLPNKDPRKVYRSIRKTLGGRCYRRDLIDVSDECCKPASHYIL